MESRDGRVARYSRREFAGLALAGVPAAFALPNLPWSTFAEINSKFKGVQIGAITYSFNRIGTNAEDIIKAYVTIGLGEMELMANHAEALAGAPSGRPAAPATVPATVPATSAGQGRGRAALTPEQQAARDEAVKALHDWRASASEATFRPVRKRIEDAGIDLRVLCYNMNVNTTKDEDIEYGFSMAKWLGTKAISTSTQVSMAKRLAPFAERHKMMVGFHGHDQVDRADEVHNEASFEAVMAAGKYLGANLDIGHYTAAGGDAVAFIKSHYARITNLHVKDMKRNTPGSYTPFGQGDAPIKEVLLLLSREKWDIPGNLEFEYPGDPMVEVPKCLRYCKDVLT
jgi:sugar phosphate isomerase/epimerase